MKLLRDFVLILISSMFIFYCAGKTSKEGNINLNPPDPPSNVKVSFSVKADVPQVSIYWTDNSDDEEGFKVYARSADETSYKLISKVPSDSTNYLDSESELTKTYYYRVNAFNKNGESSSDIEGLRLGCLATINKSNIVDYEIYGNTLFLLSGDGISSIDINDPGEPVFNKTLPLKGPVRKGFLEVAYPNLYVRDGTDFYVIDIEDRSDLSIKAAISLPFDPLDMEFYDETLIFLDENSLHIMDASGLKPKIVRSLKTEGQFQNLAVSKGLLFASKGREGIWVYDISDPRNPVVKKKYAPEPKRYYSSVSTWDGKVIASVRDFENALQIISFESGDLYLRGTISLNWTPLDASASKNVLLVPESEAGMELILAINPSNMRMIGSLDSEIDKVKASNGLILASYHDSFYILSTP